MSKRQPKKKSQAPEPEIVSLFIGPPGGEINKEAALRRGPVATGQNARFTQGQNEAGEVTNKLQFELTLKDALLFTLSLWAMDKEKPEGAREEANEAYSYLKEYLLDLVLVNFSAKNVMEGTAQTKFSTAGDEGEDEQTRVKQTERYLNRPVVIYALLHLYGQLEEFLRLQDEEYEISGQKAFNEEIYTPEDIDAWVGEPDASDLISDLPSYPTPVNGLPQNKGKGKAPKKAPGRDKKPIKTEITTTVEPEPEYFKMGLHGARQFFGNSQQGSLFSNDLLNEFSTKFDTPVESQIDRMGIDLTDTQFRVLEGVLKAFSSTDYKGTEPARTKTEIKNKRYPRAGALPSIYQNLEEIPRIRLNQRELTRLSGFNDEAQKDKIEVSDAIQFLGLTQFCFYYQRLSIKEKKVEVDKNGKPKMEEVIAVDTPLKVKVVIDEETKVFKYYEIEPSAIWLDQIQSYHLLIPHNWREEVRTTLQAKRLSSYLLTFLLYLRYQFEQKRRSKSGNPHDIRMTWEAIARAIRIPEHIIKTKRKWVNDTLLKAYSDAQTLGYLSTFSREEVDILTLNPDKYYTPKGLPEPPKAGG